MRTYGNTISAFIDFMTKEELQIALCNFTKQF